MELPSKRRLWLEVGLLFAVLAALWLVPMGTRSSSPERAGEGVAPAHSTP